VFVIGCVSCNKFSHFRQNLNSREIRISREFFSFFSPQFEVSQLKCLKILVSCGVRVEVFSPCSHAATRQHRNEVRQFDFFLRTHKERKSKLETCNENSSLSCQRKGTTCNLASSNVPPPSHQPRSAAPGQVATPRLRAVLRPAPPTQPALHRHT
jgi:hypothetical protein